MSCFVRPAVRSLGIGSNYMYCPVDGMEYREGITRCPEHDVDLVDEFPEAEEEKRPLLESVNDRAAVRVAFYVLLAAAVVYALSGVVSAVLFWFPSIRDGEDVGPFRFVQALNTGAWSTGVAAFAAIAGAVLVRTYSRLRDPAEAPSSEPAGAPSAGERAMRLLFALVVLFSLLWAVTGVATSWTNAEYTYGVFQFGAAPGPEPSDTFVSLVALHGASYSCGTAALAVMGASLVKRTHARMTRSG